ADLDNAVTWSIRAIFTNSGQVCLAGSRLYVHRKIYDDFLRRFTRAAEAMKVGDPKHESTEIGPLASQTHYKKVRNLFDTITDAVGTIATGSLDEGIFVRPTVVTGLCADAPHQRNEIFGPIVTVTPFDTEDEVLGLVNDSPYGLNAMLF